MAITFNTKTFDLQTRGADFSTYLKSGSTLAEPYTVKQSRVLPKNVKGSVLRGVVKLSQSYLDVSGSPQVAVITISSSIPNDCPSATLTALEADFKAAAVVNAAIPDTIFRGSVYTG